MVRVAKDGRYMNLRDENQLAAFKNEGWTVAEAAASAPKHETSEAEVPDIPARDGADAKSRYTKTEINRMATADLQKLGAEIGIEGADGKSGSELKTAIIGKLGL